MDVSTSVWLVLGLSLVAANLLTDIKTEVHRSTAKTVTFTFTWSAAVIATPRRCLFAA